MILAPLPASQMLTDSLRPSGAARSLGAAPFLSALAPLDDAYPELPGGVLQSVI